MIIGINGLANSGKDTVKDILCNLLYYKCICHIAFADPIKRFLMELFDWDEKQLWGESKARNIIDLNYTKEIKWSEAYAYLMNGFAHDFVKELALNEEKIKDLEKWFIDLKNNSKENGLSPRLGLQSLGDWGRSIDKNLWVNYTVKIINKISESFIYEKNYGLFKYDVFIISDARYINEIEALKDKDSLLLRVKRSNTVLSGSYSDHSSEKEQLDIPDSEFDAIVLNDGNLNDLNENIERIISHFIIKNEL